MKTIRFLTIIGIIGILIIGCGSTKEQTTTTTSMEGEMQQKSMEDGATSFEVNGLKVITKRTPGNPVIATGFYLDSGTRYEPVDLAGIERFMFETATRGTESLSKDELNARLESMGTDIGTEVTYDYNGLTMTSLQRNFDESWSLYADILLNPTFPEAEVELVRQQQLNAIKSEQDDPDSYLQRISNDLYYEGHPYAVSLNGTTESIEGFSSEALSEYHTKNVVKSRGVLIVVGDISPSDVRAKAAELASALTAGTGEYSTEEIMSFDAGVADLKIISRDLPTNYIRGLCIAPAPGSDDYPAFFAAMNILDDKLFEEIRTKRNLSYAPASGISVRKENYGILYVTTVAPDTTIKVMFETIDGMIAEPLPEKELTDMITQTITRELMGQETAAAQRSELARYEIVGGDWRKSESYINELKQVTPEAVQASMAKYARNFHFGVVGDSTKIDRELFTSK
ncbi:MAG: insulinase family protein [Candidatus Marinimicrobia bacterium]|nr:insulinase family protein [Candidatus Neomarinimicrobiota bacterium]MCF7828696.1 insulinase family protein [Candidatus Neomarinimicrobiota bacterium]MCF7880437.1 insulinase family protein [Candidatus Neomarinimicrobiota bacterium]